MRINPTYYCQYVSYFDFLVNTPIHGNNCTGPAGTYPGGMAIDQSMGTTYWCDYIEGSGSSPGVYVFGQQCRIE